MTKIIDFTERLKQKDLEDALMKLDERCLDSLVENGYYIHVVFPDKTDKYPKGWASVHTHGLEWTADHLNLEIQLAIDPDISIPVIEGAVSQIFEGHRFEPGRSNKVIRDFDVLLLPVVNDEGEELLRIILPDGEGNLDESTIAPKYRVQFWQAQGKT